MALPDTLHNIVEIRTNQRFATFKATDGAGETVFVKQICHPELGDSLRKEMYALERMRQTALGMNGVLPFGVPKVLDNGQDYVVTSWAEGSTMAFGHDLPDQPERIRFFARSFAALDRATLTTAPGRSDLVIPTKKNETAVQRLERIIPGMAADKFFAKNLLDAAFGYLHEHSSRVMARFTHGDFTPSNVIEHESQRVLVDWESGSELLPRFYDLVNFTFNWANENPALVPDMRLLTNEFFSAINSRAEDHLVQLNTIAMLRALSYITELLSEPNDIHNTASTMTAEKATSIQAAIDRILSDKLYMRL
jgi:aminoglycoside phosphotransferase (APT) family kinase protein